MIHQGRTNGKAAFAIDLALGKAYPHQAFEIFPRRSVQGDYILTIEWLRGPITAEVEKICRAAAVAPNKHLSEPTQLVFRQVMEPEHMTIH